jgi:hypothetical protein
MPSWIQHPITGKLIPRDEYVRPKQIGHAIHGDIESFVSPIDGTVISDRKQYDEHCRKHNVVNAAEFTPEYYQRKAKERAAEYEGNRSTAERFEIKQQMWEITTRMERENG